MYCKVGIHFRINIKTKEFFTNGTKQKYKWNIQSWIFKCVAVAVAVATAANKTWIFKYLKFLRIIIITIFMFLLKLQTVVVI